MIVDGTWRVAVGVTAHWQISVARRLHALVGRGGLIVDAPVCRGRVQVRAVWARGAGCFVGTDVLGSCEKTTITNESYPIMEHTKRERERVS